MSADRILDFCSIKGLRFLKGICIPFDLLISKRNQFALLVFTHDVEDTYKDIVTQPAIPFQTDQFSFLVAHDAVTVSKADKLDKSLIVCADADSFLQGVQIVLERGNLGMFVRLYHQYRKFFLFHIITSKIVIAR